MDYTYDPVNKYYAAEPKNNPKDRINLEIGDSKDPTTFHPQLKIMRWDNEVNLSLRFLVDSIPGVQSETLSNGVIEYTKGQYKVRFYDKPDASEEGGYEFEIEIPKKPPINSLTFSINTKNLDYFYQPALTQEEINRGDTRPDNVVGSYAVYHNRKGGMYDAKGKEYKCGKAFHIYRPHITDANGNSIWAELNIDINAETLTITVDQTWLDTAVYPIVVDPTFGFISAGNTNSGIAYCLPATCDRRGYAANLSVDATIQKMSVYLDSSHGDSADIYTALFRHNSEGVGTHAKVAGAERADLTVSTTEAWYDFTFASESLTADDYILSILGNGNDMGTVTGHSISIRSDSVINTDSYSESLGTVYGTETDPWVRSENLNSMYSIYAILDTVAGTYSEYFSGAGSFSWISPTSVTSVVGECYGGGGGGGGASGTKSSGGGGAGGAYAMATITVTSGGTYPVVAGAKGTAGTNVGGVGGSSWFANTGSLVAVGGGGGTNANINNSAGGGAAGGTVGCVGAVIYRGGNGATGTGGTSVNARAGGGGGGAGTAGVGGNASGSVGGTASPLGGGGGGGGGTAGENGVAGTSYSGGGGGGFTNNTTDRTGGAGGIGGVILTYVISGAAEAGVASWKTLLGVGQA